MFIKQVVPGSTSRLTIVDHNETYGRHILDKVVRNEKISNCIDIGCGDGKDLRIVKTHHPHAELFGIDTEPFNQTILDKSNIKQILINVENTKLSFESNSIDFIIANQILEHTKEIFFYQSRNF